jgi:hypothetical protein
MILVVIICLFEETSRWLGIVLITGKSNKNSKGAAKESERRREGVTNRK